jgi:hypothetical protein
LRGKTEKK